MADTKVQFAFRVPPDYIERLEVLADKMELDRAEVARRALYQGIGSMETSARVAENPVAQAIMQLVNVMESDPDEREEIRRVLSSISNSKKSKNTRKKPAPA